MQITDAKVIAGRLSKVRDIMKSEGVDIYVVVAVITIYRSMQEIILRKENSLQDSQALPERLL
ncbi:MAG: hypothetical protein ACLS9K_03000 [Lachnospira eligens]